MNRGMQFGMVGAALVALLSTAGCASQQEQVRPDLGAAQRAEARSSLERALPRSLGEGSSPIDLAWTDRCAHATNAAFFRPATGTSCMLSGIAVYPLGSAATPAEAVRAAATALRTSGITSEDVAAGRIGSDGAVAGFDDQGSGTVGIGNATGDDTFAIASADDPSALAQLPEDPDGEVVASEPGLGRTGRARAVRDSGARYVLILTHEDEYFRSLTPSG